MRIHMTTRVITVRHGEAEGNVSGIALGTMESPLTDLGRKQALDLASKIKEYSPKQFYTSPIGRAYETCHIIGTELKAKFIQDDAKLRERYIGSRLQGATHDACIKLLGDEVTHFNALPLRKKLHHRFKVAPDAEIPYDAEHRMKLFIKEMVRRHPGETVLAVTHAAALASLLAPGDHVAFEGVFGGDAIPNLAIYVIDYDPKTNTMRVS